jgi:hypothetical protein
MKKLDKILVYGSLGLLTMLVILGVIIPQPYVATEYYINKDGVKVVEEMQYYEEKDEFICFSDNIEVPCAILKNGRILVNDIKDQMGVLSIYD